MADCTTLSSTLGLLQHLSIDELKEVLNDNDKFENITKEAKINKDTSDNEMLIASNKSLAEYNLSRLEAFKEKKQQLSDLYDELEQINSVVEAKIAQIKELSKKSDSDSVLALLNAAAAEIERETDEISEKLLDGDITLEIFLDQYPGKRRLMHLRKAKVEKMTEMISRRQSYKSTPSSTPRITTIMQTNVNVNPAPGYPPLNYSNAPVNVPYPLGPVNMPMPTSYMTNHNHF